MKKRSAAWLLAAASQGVIALGVAQPVAGPDDAALENAAKSADDWLTYGRDYAETRFSPLDQIDERSVSRLGLAWSYETGSVRGHEATPLVMGGVMYATTSWSNVFAVDARTGEELWFWDAKADRARGSRACCDVVNRGAALYDGKVYVGVIDGRLVALDAKTGEPVWDVQTTPVDQPYTITGAPRIVDGKVIIGNGGAELGVRGFVSAYDARTGDLVWRFYTVPGDPSQPFESEALEAAAETWTGEWWTMGGGGTVWDAIAYDPDVRLFYVGTGNGSPWNRRIRSPGGGDNLYLASIVALDVDSGERVWHYQTVPGDTWDYTAVQQLTLADLEIDGRERKVIMQAPKNGFFYVLDRLTGELLSAEAFTRVTWAKGVDLETGRPIETAHARYDDLLTTISPGPGGAHNWQPMSFNRQTGLVYIPVSESSFTYGAEPGFEFRPNAWNVAIDMAGSMGVEGRRALPESEYEPGTGETIGAASYLAAWDPVEQAARWRVPYEGETGGGTLTTAGNLVFQGTNLGRFIVYRASDGEKLWEMELGQGIMAAASTWLLDGKQYVSVLSGLGGASALYRSPSTHYKASGRVWTFVLDGDTEVEPVRGQERPALTRIEHASTQAEIARGADLYANRCSMCHGVGAISGGTIADLRYATPAIYAALGDIARDGAYLGLGMPAFPWFTDADLGALRAYLLAQRDALIDASSP